MTFDGEDNLPQAAAERLFRRDLSEIFARTSQKAWDELQNRLGGPAHGSATESYRVALIQLHADATDNNQFEESWLKESLRCAEEWFPRILGVSVGSGDPHSSAKEVLERAIKSFLLADDEEGRNRIQLWVWQGVGRVRSSECAPPASKLLKWIQDQRYEALVRELTDVFSRDIDDELKRIADTARVKPSDLLRIPVGLQSSGDPVEGNPFADADPRHKVWDDETRVAEERWCRLTSGPTTREVSRPDAFIQSVCQHFAQKFDIWAKRGVCVVWSDRELRSYDQWLINYAEAWLQDVSVRKLYSRVVPVDDLLASLRLVLTKRVAWWKAEARRYLADLRASSVTENRPAPNYGSGLRPKPKPTVVIGADVKLADAAKFPTMTVREVMALLHISRASVYRFLDEGRLNRPGLNKKPGKRSKTLILTTSVQEMLKPAEE